MDPVSIGACITIATKAFGAIKQGISVGNDLHSMTKSVSSWMKAVSDIDHLEKANKKPTLFKKVFNASSVEEEALQIYTAKKQIEQQRYELKQFLMLTQGPTAFDELLAIEGQIRKQRQKEIYDQIEFRKKIINGIAIGILSVIIIGALSWLGYIITLRVQSGVQF